MNAVARTQLTFQMLNLLQKYHYGKNIERHAADTIVPWPNPKTMGNSSRKLAHVLIITDAS